MLRLATYNIHRCFGTDNKYAPERILAVLKELNADVIALQEVEATRDDAKNVLHFFAKELDMECVMGPTMRKKNTRYGNALLTKFPGHNIQKLDLSVGKREPRGAIGIALNEFDIPLQIFATHLGLRPNERRTQVKMLLEEFEFKENAILILMGDLNEWFLWGRPLRWLTRKFSSSPFKCTFPAKYPFLPLDRIWVHPIERLINIEKHQSAQAKIASDHLPLFVDIATSK